VAFVAEREDPGKANSRQRLAKRIMTRVNPSRMVEAGSARIYRFFRRQIVRPGQRLELSRRGFRHVRSARKWSGWTAGRWAWKKIAAAPTRSHQQFDNSAANGRSCGGK